jgi:hypothetical protein
VEAAVGTGVNGVSGIGSIDEKISKALGLPLKKWRLTSGRSISWDKEDLALGHRRNHVMVYSDSK